jgi:hypothetical protein
MSYEVPVGAILRPGVGFLLIPPGTVVVRRSWDILDLVADDAALAGRPARRSATRSSLSAG